MSAAQSANAAPAARVAADLLPGALLRDATLAVGYAVLIAASAQVAFPLPGTPVPVTAQTLVVLLGAAALGPGRAVSGALLFAVAGVAGLPWLAMTGGASLGYVAGFVVAAAVVGQLARQGWLRSMPRTAAAMIVGNVIILALGATVLGAVVGLDPLAAFQAGAAVFIVGDVLKLAIAVALLPIAQRAVDATGDR